jgi:hypothetical protein
MLIEVSGEMNHDVVFCHSINRLLVTNVEAGTPGKIVGRKEVSHERAQVSAAAGNQSLHDVKP